MERGLIDIGLLLEPVDIERFSFIRLPVTESWAVLMRPDDPLAAKQSVTAADLHELPLILPRRMPVQSELAGWFGPDFSRLQIAYTEDLSSNGGLLVQGGYGYALVIEGSVACWDPARITARPLSPALSATSVLAWRREQPLGKAAEAFLAHVRQFLSNAKKA
jgi:DNA-binding transcriptional LysR family regulator